MAVTCSEHAKEQAATSMSMLEAVGPCTTAIDTEPLDKHQLAATYVNRGVIWMTGEMLAEAKTDFDAAVRTDPRVGEGYVNRGAAQVANKQYAQGLADIDYGLSLGVEEPQRAWYNRGLAKEAMGDLKGAYESYTKAVELAPNWAPPKAELARFSVSPAR
jgi:Tfp pilus assembly protein PilF